ncbi:DUF1508 domain-containing protein [Robertkochia solimangrovi]|uniref:DUF1508 domain-containing protein n=1 Tax=Robertkochia solimangrovi TaxID=2213046 RepID=UPI00117D4454|nr:DUF1508 domain-containing protein [Robertkochia solimangrovi]TRZ44452.1 DUF1508 domain-containing protein [Robertkochia solimangrovi]
MAMFVISKQENGNFKFEYTSRKGTPIFTSITCKNKSDCEMIINAIRSDVQAFTFTRKSYSSKHYFFRIAKDGYVLATSRRYSSEQSLNNGIVRLLDTLHKGEILDFSINDFVFPEEESLGETGS